MKTLLQHINENQNGISHFEDFEEYLGDSTVTEGRICIGAYRKKFHSEVWNKKLNKEYELFVEAYESAGGDINEWTADQGIHEVWCDYSGESEACQYILTAFLRLLFEA